MLGIFSRLFGQQEKPPTTRDLRVAQMGVQRERKRKQLEMRKLAVKRSQTLESIKKSRKNNNTMEVDFLWEELKHLKIEAAYLMKEARILNLESIGLQRYIRGMARLEKTGQSARVQSLIEKVRRLGLDEKLRGAEVDEAAYLDSLKESLDEIDLELETLDHELESDPEKAKLLAQIDLINAAEEKGDFETAKAQEDKLQEQLNDDVELADDAM